MGTKRTIFGVFVITMLLGVTAGHAHASEWEWTVAPYLWAVDMDLDSGPTLGQEVSFDDLIFTF